MFFAMGRLAIALLLSAGCSSGSSGVVFIALDSDFAPFRTWDHVAVEADNLGAGHPVAPSTVYLSQHTHARSYPVGTILLKAFDNNSDPPTWDIFAMAKRGGGFNPEGAHNWEFFRLRIQESGMPLIVGRGIFAIDPTDDGGAAYSALGSAVDGLCNNCHGTSESAATDHVLTPAFAPGH
jgi:hypothetical protein